MEFLLLPFHLILILIILISSSYLQPPVTASTRHDNYTDLEALLNFRANADPHGILADNWTTNASSFCDWVGVYCSRRRQRVTAIKLRDIALQENFSETNLIGKGGFGSVFRGCLSDGLIVAIKVLNLDVEGSLKCFEAECQVLRMVRHKNLIKIISVCSNLDFKALILEYMPNGSLERWLYSDNHFLNLIQRLDIMVDVSLALEYLHHYHPEVVLHCDLKPTNILLDEELFAYVSDFGIAKLIHGDSKSAATTSMPGTIGYIAPEYATSGAVSRMSDVYGFGILLLEVIIGKKPVNSVFGEQSNLREWICNAHSNAIMDVVDQNILKFHDPSNDLQKLLRCLSSLIELGLLCSKYSPKERISMMDVGARLRKIKIEYLSS